jgi:glycosyltransferase involved in cell wall biosynthesis
MRVGVIVAARAPVPYLAEALRSVLSQDPRPDEVVVVDHASQPPLEGLPGGVRVVRTEFAGGGPAVARATGLAELGTDLVALADADDVWEPGKLRTQLAALQRHPDAAVCFGRAVVIDSDGQPTGERVPELGAGLLTADALLRSGLYETNAIPAASALVRRAALEQVGGFVPESPLPAATDWDLWLRLVAAGFAFVCEPAARVRYRRHAGGLTADVVRLGEAGLAIHERYAGMVDPETARDARARDLETLARGRIRQRRYTEAVEALREAAALRPPGPRERLLRTAVAIPGVRSTLGRRNPYRNSKAGLGLSRRT